MVEVKVIQGGVVTTKSVDAAAFGSKVLGRTLKDAIVMYEDNARQGTVQARTRAMVKGPNKKLWPQKHTGRARMGTPKSPLWRGGGRIHPPEPREHRYAMPVKARRTALRNAIFTKFRDQEVAIADGWPTGKPNTKSAVAILKKLGIGSSVTVVTTEVDRNHRFKVASKRGHSADDAGASTERNDGDAAFRAQLEHGAHRVMIGRIDDGIRGWDPLAAPHRQ